jgi:succinate dehydrogenase / fumarate reductase membrane anchor subunit
MKERKYSLMNESWSMILTYISAMILVFVLTFHLLLQSPLAGKAFEDTLTFGYATGNLVYYKVVFGLLLYAAILHGLNGVRVIVLEWFHPQEKAWLLNLIVVALMAFFLALGSYTLLAVG